MRTFLIQGSWNYRTLMGSGFAYALLPMLRARFRGDPEGLQRAVERHLRPFNSHPYLVGIAAGAVARLENEDADPQTIGRFKDGIRGSLGSLGDGLVWASLRPLALLVALTVSWLGGAPYLVIAIFLILYNVGHLWLRAWSFSAGLREGIGVGERLRSADLNGVTQRLRAVSSLLLGALTGVLAIHGLDLGRGAWLWLLVCVVGFAAGSRVGYSAWRPTAVLVAMAVLALSILGLA